MVKKIISERHLVVKKIKVIEFDHISGDGGYSFEADDDFNVKFDDKFEEIQRASYQHAMNSAEYLGPFQRIHENRYMENAKAICECGNQIELWDQYQGACECEHCGQWHNLFGQSLINPEYWESEVAE